MSSSIVNFLITDPNNASNLISDPRVFDYRIGAAEQTFFNGLMDLLHFDLTELAKPLSEKTPSETTRKELAWHINCILGTLNTWSKMKVSTDSGVVINPVGELLNPATSARITPATTMSSEMANAVDNIFRTMRSAGWDPISQYGTNPNDFRAATPSGNAKIAIDAIKKITDDMDPSGNNTIYPISTWIAQGRQAAQNALLIADSSGVIDTSNTSLQQLLMVEYVSNGNKLLYDQMDALSTAINSNQEALSYLNSLQSLMNQKSPEQFVLALGKLASPSLTDQNYTDFEKESFNNTLATTANFTEDTISTYISALTTQDVSTTGNATIADLTNKITTLQGEVNTFKPMLTTLYNKVNDVITAQNAIVVPDITTLKTSLQTYTTAIGSNANALYWSGLNYIIDPAFYTTYITGSATGEGNDKDIMLASKAVKANFENYLIQQQNLTNAVNNLNSNSTYDDLQSINYLLSNVNTLWGKVVNDRTQAIHGEGAYSLKELSDTDTGSGFFNNFRDHASPSQYIDFDPAKGTDPRWQPMREKVNYLVTGIASTGAKAAFTQADGILASGDTLLTQIATKLSYMKTDQNSTLQTLASTAYNTTLPAVGNSLDTLISDMAAYRAFIAQPSVTATALNAYIIKLTSEINTVVSNIASMQTVLYPITSTLDSANIVSAVKSKYEAVQNYYNTLNTINVQTALNNALPSIKAVTFGEASSGSAAGAFLDIASTSSLFTVSLQRIKDNLGHIITTIQEQTGASGTALASSLNTVLNDFKSITSIETWVKDFDKTQNNQGNYQTNLNNAVVASQALNDAKREELQRSMFIFEEFYKSAMALLSRLTQLIEKMATSITR